MQYSIVQYSTVQYSTVQYSTVQYNTVQYSKVEYSSTHSPPQQCITKSRQIHTPDNLPLWEKVTAFTTKHASGWARNPGTETNTIQFISCFTKRPFHSAFPLTSVSSKWHFWISSIFIHIYQKRKLTHTEMQLASVLHCSM